MKLNLSRLHDRIEKLSEIGPTPEGGARRIALTNEDKLGRDLLIRWMKEIDLNVQVDEIGNIFGILKGSEDEAPIMMGSHIDTVGNGGHLDGCFGVLSGLEVIAAYVDSGETPRHDLCVAIFTNEEGVRFHPDMMGSLVYAGGMDVEEAHRVVGNDGAILKDELIRTDYLGEMKCGSIIPHAFVELHIEQGPILEEKGIHIGAVENLQGISWSRIVFKGQANHAGTTPMEMRYDAGYAAAKLAVATRKIAIKVGDGQVSTVGVITPKPNLINVVPGEVEVTVDLRNSDEEKLKSAEQLLDLAIQEICKEEGVSASTKKLARFEPVQFDKQISKLIYETASSLGYSVLKMTSGAGHDAQMMARICPAAMIFVPSKDGISHNPSEFTSKEDLNRGAETLFRAVIKLDQGNAI
jgi:N-carbamoyl-L-amino-acid hydrolase